MTFHKRLPPVGSRPGTLAIPEGSPPPAIHMFDYRGERLAEREIADPADLRAFLASPDTTWVDVAGFGDEAVLRAIGDLFELHPLTLEDATTGPQRARHEVAPTHQLIIARCPILGEQGAIEVPQVSIILRRNTILTLQDRHFGFFGPVRKRLREGIGPIRDAGPDYLASALLDTLVDRYFPVVEELASELEELEDRVNEEPDPELLVRLHHVRRQLVLIRRSGWPQRETLRSLGHDASPFIGAEARVYLRSTEQHITQIMEAVDSAREMTAGLVDIYLSSVSQRTNEVMKVLTLMASIFIPLTFVAGIYGMNFTNMPELGYRWAYPAALGLMAAIAVAMLVYFRRKGWFGPRRRRGG
jgi:magnesium transporter